MLTNLPKIINLYVHFLKASLISIEQLSKFFGQILGTFPKILGIFWVILEPTENHKRQPQQPENWI